MRGQWLGVIRAPISGEVTFHAEADNGLRLWLCGDLIIDGWSEKGQRNGIFSFQNQDAMVPIRLEFYQLGGDASMKLFWSWPGHSLELIPNTYET